MSRRTVAALLASAAASVLLLSACAPTTSEPAASPSETGAPALSGEVVVYAAASLTDSFDEIAALFSEEYPEVTVTFNFGGSSSLAEGIISGAPVDVFASASPATMTTVTEAGLTDGDPTVFAANVLEIAVPVGNPGDVTGIADFADESKTIALCAAEVPCGAASAAVFEAAGITPVPDTLEQDVRAALTKVQLGEVDAAMVYRTDVLAAGDEVEGIEFDEAADAVNDYPIAVLSDSTDAVIAQAFVDFVLSTEGQAVLADAGFQTE